MTIHPEYVQSLDRGLAVIRCFDEDHQRLTIADIAREAGLTRATARRFLHTLEGLGYVGSHDGRFFLRARILELGYAYLSSVAVSEIAHEHLLPLADHFHESCSASVLDDQEIVYIARAQTNRIMTIALALGSRLPAYATSMGRVLLANLPPDELEAYLAKLELRPLTDRTVVDRRKFKSILRGVARDGYCLIDQELELGVRSVAVPICDASMKVVAAINVSAHAARVPVARLCDEFVPQLLQVAQEINADLAVRR